jgi:hypothetical protein
VVLSVTGSIAGNEQGFVSAVELAVPKLIEIQLMP